MNDPQPLFDLPAQSTTAAEGSKSRRKSAPADGPRWGKYTGKRTPCGRCVQGRHEADMASRRPGGVMLGRLPILADAKLTRTAPDGTKTHYCDDHAKLAQMLDLATTRRSA